eukprot:1400791-Pyramimonas_sp.AAC.1
MHTETRHVTNRHAHTELYASKAVLDWHLAESFPSTQEPFRALPTEERKKLQPIMHTLYNNISQLLGQVDPAAKIQQDAETEHPWSGSADMVMPSEDAALEKGKAREVAISVVQPREANDAITAAETVKVSASFDTMSPLDPVTQVSYTLSPICTQGTVMCTTIPTC